MTNASRRDFLKLTGAALASTKLAHALESVHTLNNKLLEITMPLDTPFFSVKDLRTGKLWQQRVDEDWVDHPKSAVYTPDLIFHGVTARPLSLELTGTYTPSNIPIRCTITLHAHEPEFTVAIVATGEMPYSLNFPHAFVGGGALILPINEGVRYPVDDPAPKTTLLEAYAGHGLCMPWWGLTDAGGSSMMAIIETRADMRLHVMRKDKQLYAAPQWQPQKNAFGYERQVRYVFLERGGHVAMCKRYREHAKQTGLVKTLAEKKQQRPAVDRLIGAVNVWCYDADSTDIAKDMQSAGIERILWSAAKGSHVADLNKLGCLTSTYDLYSDIMDPANYPKLGRAPHGRWIPEAWPTQIILDKDQQPLSGWKVKAADGTLIACGVSNDQFRPAWARKRIAAELATTPYNARFIDTVGASRWMEDYSPAHPMTRTQCGALRTELMKVTAEEFHLVAGTETGIDTLVPYTDFLEGMESLVTARLPDEKYSKDDPWPAEVTDDFTRFQIGAAYRLPLWELVYHDCIVSTWWWGDYNNVVPALWDRLDLFNILYGTMPMFRFRYKYFQANRDRFAASYKKIAAITRSTGYSEMTAHRSLTSDNLVQQTQFANGATVTVNFGEQPYALGTKTIAGGSYLATGIA